MTNTIIYKLKYYEFIKDNKISVQVGIILLDATVKKIQNMIYQFI